MMSLVVVITCGACAHGDPRPAEGDPLLAEGEMWHHTAAPQDRQLNEDEELRRAREANARRASILAPQAEHPPGPDLEPEVDPSSPERLPFFKTDRQEAGGVWVRSAVEDDKAFGGFGRSGGLPRPITDVIDAARVRPGEVQLIVRGDEPAPSPGRHSGLTAYLVNATDGEVWFMASDSRLSVVQEALDGSGAWRPVEWLPQSWCGNSYHRVRLGPSEAWRVTIPRYKGSIKTKLRLRLSRGADGASIISNTFDGSVNPEQFNRPRHHRSRGLMDPYGS